MSQQKPSPVAASQAPACDYIHVHPELIQQVHANMPQEEQLYDLAELFKAFADSSRIRILYVLFESEMCVCDIAQLLSMSISAVSHHLRLLKQARLVRFRKEGKTVLYSLDDDHVRGIISRGMEHIEE